MSLKAYISNIQKFCVHDGPGIRTAIFFLSCPLRCGWCANPESINPPDEKTGKLYSIDELVEICLKDVDFYIESGGGVTLTGGEVLMQADFAALLLTALKEKSIHTAVETSGFAAAKTFEKLLAADLLLYDLKHYDSNKHLEGTGVDNKIILQNLSMALKRNKEILIRIPIVPGYNDSPKDANRFAQLLNSLKITKAQLLPFHQFGEGKYEKLGLKYKYAGYKTLYPDDLEYYKQKMKNWGIDAFF